MKAVRYHRYGDPDVLQVDEVPEPHPGPGQVRIRVEACGVNPWDVKGRAGRRSGGKPLTEPVIPGVEAAGVVDEVGPDVAGTAVGEAVFGFTVGGAAAEYALLRHWSHTPDTVSAVEAGGMSQVGETAARGLRELGAKAGDTVLVHGASGGVGQAAVQLARHAGVTVIGTASPDNQELVRTLGATPTTYEPGLPERVAALAPHGVDGVFDTTGTSLDELIEIVGDPARVVTIANFTADAAGARVTSVPYYEALDEVADLARTGDFTVRVAATFDLAEAAAAHALVETGHAGGKVVLTVG
jgi:NADPH:quinone reductase-like Zn-dependent oxidoreductase